MLGKLDIDISAETNRNQNLEKKISMPMYCESVQSVEFWALLLESIEKD